MKVFKILASLALAFNLYAADKDHTIVVAVSPVPHAEIMEFIKPVLAKEGYDLVIKEINDYSIPNLAVRGYRKWEWEILAWDFWKRVK